MARIPYPAKDRPARKLDTGKGLVKVTPTDRLWLARSVEGEGPPHAWVAQTLVNRWAWMLSRGVRTYPTLTDLIRSYSHPVSPRWAPGGDKYLAALNEARRAPVDVREARVAEVKKMGRYRARAIARTTFSEDTIRAVSAALDGEPGVVPDIEAGTVHFAAKHVKARGEMVPVYQPKADGRINWFYRVPASSGFLYTLAPAGGSKTQPSRGDNGTALAALLAAAWWLF